MFFGIVESLIEQHDYFMETYGDPRVKNWFLMSSPVPTAFICLGYVLIVKYIGPKMMENRKPFQLKKTMIVYNFILVLFSAWIVKEGIMAGWCTTYSFRCQPVDYSTSPEAMRVAAGCWWYFFSKFIEFFDTLFFVLRKKNKQISTLHVIHHAILPFSVWWGVKFVPGGHPTFFGWVNAIVHTVMYTYYLLAALGPEIQKYLWWKKYLTTLQIFQFVLVGVHACQLLFTDCNVPKVFSWLIVTHSLLFLGLFSRFYRDAYLDNRKGTKPPKVNKSMQKTDLEATNWTKSIQRDDVRRRKNDYLNYKRLS